MCCYLLRNWATFCALLLKKAINGALLPFAKLGNLLFVVVEKGNIWCVYTFGERGNLLCIVVEKGNIWCVYTFGEKGNIWCVGIFGGNENFSTFLPLGRNKVCWQAPARRKSSL